MAILEIVLQIAGLYVLIGLIFSLLFIAVGAGKIDPNAKKSTIGFKLVIIPGAMLFWPVLALRWLKGTAQPPIERTAHDRQVG